MLKLARFAAIRRGWPTADMAFEEALDAAAGDAAAEAQIHAFAAASREERLDWAAAVAGYDRALEIYRARSAGQPSRGAASSTSSGAWPSSTGTCRRADQHLRRALDIREKAAPQSAAVANSLHNLGLVAAGRGDLDSRGGLLPALADPQ